MKRITSNLNHWCTIVGRIRVPKNSQNRWRESPLCGDSLPRSGNFSYFGAAFPPPVAIEVKFCTATRTDVPVGPAKFDVNRCNESPPRGEKPDFWPVSKFNTGSFRLHWRCCGTSVPYTPKLHPWTANLLHICNKIDTALCGMWSVNYKVNCCSGLGHGG